VVFLCVPRVVYIVVVSAYVWACACGRAGAWACACGRARACAPVCFARAATVSASVVVLRMGGVRGRARVGARVRARVCADARTRARVVCVRV